MKKTTNTAATTATTTTQTNTEALVIEYSINAYNALEIHTSVYNREIVNFLKGCKFKWYNNSKSWNSTKYDITFSNVLESYLNTLNIEYSVKGKKACTVEKPLKKIVEKIENESVEKPKAKKEVSKKIKMYTLSDSEYEQVLEKFSEQIALSIEKNEYDINDLLLFVRANGYQLVKLNAYNKLSKAQKEAVDKNYTCVSLEEFINHYKNKQALVC